MKSTTTLTPFSSLFFFFLLFITLSQIPNYVTALPSPYPSPTNSEAEAGPELETRQANSLPGTCTATDNQCWVFLPGQTTTTQNFTCGREYILAGGWIVLDSWRCTGDGNVCFIFF